MLTLGEEELAEELRRELFVLLHVSREEHGRLREGALEQALEGLREVRGQLVGVSVASAALRITIPPFLGSGRLRGVLSDCLKALLGREVPLSLRLPGELADTVEVAGEMAREWDRGRAVLCFVDERTAGELGRPLVELKAALEQRVEPPLEAAYPVTFYDVLCRWEGAGEGVVWGPETTIAAVYQKMTERRPSATARDLEALRAFVAPGAPSE